MKSLRIFWLVLVVPLVFCSFTGCKETKQEQQQTQMEETPSSTEKAAPEEPLPAEFAISYPENNGQVDRNVITLRGVGAQDGDEIQLEVFTDGWYLQDGNYDIDRNDGTWTYSPCYLMGRGSYSKHHNIRAKLLKNGQVLAKHTIFDVAAPEP